MVSFSKALGEPSWNSMELPRSVSDSDFSLSNLGWMRGILSLAPWVRDDFGISWRVVSVTELLFSKVKDFVWRSPVSSGTTSSTGCSPMWKNAYPSPPSSKLLLVISIAPPLVISNSFPSWNWNGSGVLPSPGVRTGVFLSSVGQRFICSSASTCALKDTSFSPSNPGMTYSNSLVYTIAWGLLTESEQSVSGESTSLSSAGWCSSVRELEKCVSVTEEWSSTASLSLFISVSLSVKSGTGFSCDWIFTFSSVLEVISVASLSVWVLFTELVSCEEDCITGPNFRSSSSSLWSPVPDSAVASKDLSFFILASCSISSNVLIFAAILNISSSGVNCLLVVSSSLSFVSRESCLMSMWRFSLWDILGSEHMLPSVTLFAEQEYLSSLISVSIWVMS